LDWCTITYPLLNFKEEFEDTKRVIRIHKSKKSRQPAPVRGGFSRYIGPGSESQEGSCESLNSPIALAIDVLFRFFHFIWYFQLFLVYLVYQWFYWTSDPQFWETSQHVPGPQNSLVPPWLINFCVSTNTLSRKFW
jgi:hypothetical protein